MVRGNGMMKGVGVTEESQGAVRRSQSVAAPLGVRKTLPKLNPSSLQSWECWSTFLGSEDD